MTDKEKKQLMAEVKASLLLMQKTLNRAERRIESIKRETQDMKKTFAKIQS